MERLTFGIGGSALSVLADGPEDGDVVVLLHGLLTGAELWRDVAGVMVESGHRVLAVDLPGHGETLTPARADHSPGGMAELVGTWLRTTAGTAPWVIGHDLGAGVAQVVATRYPMALSHLTLTGAMVDDRWPLPFVDRLQKRAASSVRTSVSAARLHRWVDRGVGPGDVPVATVDRVFATVDGTPEAARALDRAVLAMDTADTVVAAAQLSRLPMPVDLAWGSHDPYTPADEVAGRLLELAPQAEMALVDEAGHWAPMERPEAFVVTCLELRARDRRPASAPGIDDGDADEATPA